MSNINKSPGTSPTPKVVSFFTGAGGLDLGFRAAGFEIACCVELERWACDTLRANHPDTPVWGPPLATGNIRDLDAEKLLEFLSLSPNSIDVVVGGPPCQTFSTAANQRFLKGDSRFKRQGFSDFTKGMLLFEFVRFIKALKPTVFLLENVPGLLTIDGGEQLGLVLDELSSIGYSISPTVVTKAVSYGVPQYRERLIIWGTNKKDVTPSMPPPTHGDKDDLFSKSHNVVAQALSGVTNNLPNHVTRAHLESSVDRYRTLNFGQREKKGRVDRLDPARPSKTVIAGGMHGGGRSHLHPFLARTLSVRESARIQTFPDDYVFKGTVARQFTQVGNAVPPLLAEHFARVIGSTVFGFDYSTSPLVHEKILNQKTSKEILIKRMFTEAHKENPLWIYDSHRFELPKNHSTTAVDSPAADNSNTKAHS